MSPDNKKLFDFIKAFLVPTVLGKIGILYFGLSYSSYPDQGYGYGLVLSIAFTLFNLGRLVYKYRNHEEL